MNTLSIPVAHLSPLDRLAAEDAVKSIAPLFPEVQLRLNYEPGSLREECIPDSELRTRLRTKLDGNYNIRRATLEDLRHQFEPTAMANELCSRLYQPSAVQLAVELATMATPTTIITKALVLKLIDKLAGPLPTTLLEHASRTSYTYAFRQQDWTLAEIAATIDRTREILAHELCLIANNAHFSSSIIREELLALMIARSGKAR